jgi:hypothetical protein
MLQALRLVAAASLSVTLARSAFADTDACIAAAERGQQQRRDGQLQSAQTTFVRCQQAECPPAIVKDCTTWLEEAQQSQPTIVVSARDQTNRERTDVVLSIDGQHVSNKLDGRPIPLDPGQHTLVVEWSEGPPTSIDLLAREGERQRMVDVRLQSTVVVPDTPRTPWGVWVLGGVGLVGMGVGATLWAIGLSERSKLYDACGISRVCTDGDKSGPQTKLVVGDVSFFVGAAALVVATVWLLASPHANKKVAQTFAMSF